MVLGHSGIYGRSIGVFTPFNFIYLFHMSLFFFYSGYFFREVNLKTPWKFLKGKITTLYIPTIKYGIMFLVLCNLMIPLHLSNQAPIGSWSEFWNNGLDPIIRFYDTEQMMGAFWFLRVLFFANIIFWLLFRITHAVGRGRYKLLILGSLILISSSAGFYINIHEIWPPLNWIRELCILPIFFIGYLFGQYEKKIPMKWWIALITLAWLMYCSISHCINIGSYIFVSPHFFLISSLAGIYGTIYLAHRLTRLHHRLSSTLVYIGKHSFDILLWHFLAFKVVSYLRILWSDLPIDRLSMFPVLEGGGRYDFIAYTIIGVGLPLLLTAGLSRIVSLVRRI